MKNLLFIGICAAGIAFSVTACSKSGNTPAPPTQNNVTVYVAGNSGGDTAVYWKNGLRMVLYPGDSSYATAIVVSDSDVYVAGQLGTGAFGIAGGYVFPYWKNQQLNALAVYGSTTNSPNYTDGRVTNGVGVTNGVAVSGSDVYILANGNGYWKNGQVVIYESYYFHSTLVDSTFVGSGTGIAVSGSNVYLSGQYVGFINDIYNSESPAYWDNQQLTLLNPATAVTTGIALSNADVYVSGYIPYYKSGVLSGDSAVYWKNGQLVTLSPNAIATGIAVSDGNVYVSGYTSGTAAVYWKNGQQIVLGNGEAKGIAVAGSDVYVCGMAGYNSYPYPPYYAAYDTAAYWKNGQETVLGANSGATSIALQ